MNVVNGTLRVKKVKIIRYYLLYNLTDMKDFVPEVTELPSITKPPKFEYVSKTMQDLAHWIPQNQVGFQAAE